MCFMLTISSLAPSDENRVFVLNASRLLLMFLSSFKVQVFSLCSEHEMDAWVQNLREAANFLDRRRNYDREVAVPCLSQFVFALILIYTVIISIINIVITVYLSLGFIKIMQAVISYKICIISKWCYVSFA
jgi:hypothetical protein